MYFHFRSMRISFISKVTRVHKAMTVANNTSLCSTILVVLLEFIPVDRAEISHINRQQNSFWYPSQPGYQAHMTRLKEKENLRMLNKRQQRQTGFFFPTE